MGALPTQPNQSLLEGIEVLLAVARAREGVRVRALARELGMTPTRLQRYLGTLAHSGLLRQFPDRRYGTGPGMHALSAISLTASGLAGRSMEVLPELSELGLVVALGVLWRRSVTYLYFHSPEATVARSLGRQADYPAEESSIGRILLAEEDEEAIRARLPGCGASLLRDIRRARTCGYAEINRENGETSLALPVGSPPIAGLAVSGQIPKHRLPMLIRRLKKAAGNLMDNETTLFP